MGVFSVLHARTRIERVSRRTFQSGATMRLPMLGRFFPLLSNTGLLSPKKRSHSQGHAVTFEQKVAVCCAEFREFKEDCEVGGKAKPMLSDIHSSNEMNGDVTSAVRSQLCTTGALHRGGGKWEQRRWRGGRYVQWERREE